MCNVSNTSVAKLWQLPLVRAVELHVAGFAVSTSTMYTFDELCLNRFVVVGVRSLCRYHTVAASVSTTRVCKVLCASTKVPCTDLPDMGIAGEIEN